MSKRIVFNDRELATHADVQDAQNWVSRDVGRVLEGITQGTFDDTSSTVNVGIAVVSGLEITRSPSNLDVIVSAGSALFYLPTTSDEQDSHYKLGVLEADVSLPLSSSVSNDIWYVIEVGVSEVVTNELRGVKSPTGGFVDTSIPKVKVVSLTASARPGTSAIAGAAAFLPVIQPSPDKLPIAIVNVGSGTVTLASAAIMDFRKLLGRFNPPVSSYDSYSGDGFLAPVSFHASPDEFSVDLPLSSVTVSRNTVSIGGYSGPLSTSTSAFNPVVTTPLPPHLVVNDTSFTGFSGSPWNYIYAYRPSPACGYTTLCFSEVPPTKFGQLSGPIPDGLHPSAPFTPPRPFDQSSTIDPSMALCMGAVLFYDDAGTTKIRNSSKSGGYTRQTYSSIAGVTPSGTSGGEVVTGVASFPLTFSPAALMSGVNQPNTASGVLLNVDIRVPAGGSSAAYTFLNTAATSENSILYTTFVNAGEYSSFSLEVPFMGPSPSVVVVPGLVTPGVSIDIRAVGFYEAY